MSDSIKIDPAKSPTAGTAPELVETSEENKLIAERRAKLTAIRAQGVAFPNDFRRDAYAGDLHKQHAGATAEQLEADAIAVKVAGRMLAKRVMGKASFATIADPTGRIQLFLQASALPDAYDAFKGWDIGDIAGRRRHAVSYPHGRIVREGFAGCGCWSSRCGPCPTNGMA